MRPYAGTAIDSAASSRRSSPARSFSSSECPRRPLVWPAPPSKESEPSFHACDNERRRGIAPYVPARRWRRDAPPLAGIDPRLGRSGGAERNRSVPEAIGRGVHGQRHQPERLVGQGSGGVHGAGAVAPAAAAPPGPIEL